MRSLNPKKLGARGGLKGLGRTFRFIWNHPIGRRDRARSLIDFVRWQVGSRLVSGPVVVPFVEETVLVARPGMAGATGNIYVGLHEFHEMAFLLHLLRPEDHFADVGANVGNYALLASGVVGARSTAFEPVPTTYASLARNVAVNGLAGRLRARNVAVGSAPGSLRLTADRDCENRVATAADRGATVEVEVVTLDDACVGAIPKLVKIDVEGFEGAVLEGAREVLQSAECQALIIEFNGCGGAHGFDERALFEGLITDGFQPVLYHPFQRRLTQREVAWPRPGNVVMVKDAGAAADTLASARRYRVKRTTL